MKDGELKEGKVVWYPVVETAHPSFLLKMYRVSEISEKTVVLIDPCTGNRSKRSKIEVLNSMYADKMEALQQVRDGLEREIKHYETKIKKLNKLKKGIECTLHRGRCK